MKKRVSKGVNVVRRPVFNELGVHLGADGWTVKRITLNGAEVIAPSIDLSPRAATFTHGEKDFKIPQPSWRLILTMDASLDTTIEVVTRRIHSKRGRRKS